MSIETNSNNKDISKKNICNDENEIINEEKEKEKKIEYEVKIKRIKEKLKNLIKSTLGKNLLNLETKAKEHIQILTSTTKTYNEFNKKIKFLTKQVEENKKRKEENKSKIKKLKNNSSKIRSKTVQMGNRGKLNIVEQKSSTTNLRVKKYNNNFTYKLIYENIKPTNKTRSKTVDPRERLNQNSSKKPDKNLSLLFNTENMNNTNSNNNIIKLRKYNSGKLISKEHNFNQNKKIIFENNNKYHNSSKTKNNLSKPKQNKNSSTNILIDTKDNSEKTKYLNKRIVNKKDSFKETRKSQDFLNKNIPKPRTNNYNKKNIELFSEKKINSNKKYIKENNKNDNEKDNESENILKRFEKQREILENIRKKREIINEKEEEKRKEKEKELEEEGKKEEKKKEKKREERIKEEERIKYEERKNRQMEIEAEIEREKIVKQNFKKEMEKQREEKKKKELEKEKEKQKEIERQREIEKQKEIERKKEKEKEMEKEKKLMEEKKKEEKLIEKKKDEEIKIEVEKMKEEENQKEELPQNINFENLVAKEKNNKIDIQELLELEDQTDNSEFIHMNEDRLKEINAIEDEKIFLNSTPIPVSTYTPNPSYYRNISIFELIHDVHYFSPCMFQFLDLKDLIEFTSTSKKIKKQRIYVFNLQKNKILKFIGIEKEEILKNKIKEYEEKYSEEDLNESYIKFQLSKGALRAVQLLNNDMYSKIFRRPVLDEKYSKIYIVYRILFIFFGEFEIANILDDKLFWVKCTEFLNSKSGGKIGDFIIKKIDECNYDIKKIYQIEKLLDGKKDNIITPSYFSKFCPSTGLLIFLIKDLLEYCGIIISNKKTQLCRIYNNYKYYQKIQDTLSEFNKTIENF